MKIVNLVLGAATTIILGALIILGIKAFYPEPISPSYPNTAVVAPCASADTACQQNDQNIQQQQQNQFNNAEQAYEDQMNIYDRNLFIIANIIGILIFALGFWLIFGAKLSSQGVPIGIMLAGLWSIMYGYGRGWGSVDDQLKFFVGLVIAAMIIGGSLWLIERSSGKKNFAK
jgi:hypothetical protein